MPVPAFFNGIIGVPFSGPGVYQCWDNYLPWDIHGGYGHYHKAQSSTPEVNEPGGSKNRKYLRDKMKGKWQEDPNVFGKFFRLKGSAWKHADAVRDAWYDEDASRWKRIPATPKKAPRLTLPLRNLLNSVLEMSEIPPSRRLFLRPDPIAMKASRDPLPAPDLILAGVGPAMTVGSLRRPEAKYSCGLVPVRVMLESEFRNADRHLSAVHANEIFMEQDNRRFVYALIFTEKFLRVYMFDPAGAVIVPPLDYHARPRDFCAIIEGIASLDEVRAGFDTSISWDGFSEKRICMREPTPCGPPRVVSYRVKSRLFRASRFVGRATCCWLVEPDGEPHKLCVIKDAWIATSEAQPVLEGSLIRHANQQGVVRGLVRIRHEACVRVPGRSEDTTVKNRRIRKNTFTDDMELIEDRVHTRIVMDTYGKPLARFSNRKELLVALYDAVQAHRDLFCLAGILHRDVSLGNILINPGGEEGDRGVLIDLDFATYLDDIQTGCRMGTFKYMSLDLLQDKHIKHSYLHDLESFYYVLCWIVCEYDGPGDVESSHVTRDPDGLQDWNCKSEGAAGAAKRRHIETDFKLPITPWFGETISMLAKRLHGFFQRRSSLTRRWGGPQSQPQEDYAEFLGHLQWAVDMLPPEDEIDQLGRSVLDSHDTKSKLLSNAHKRQASEIAGISEGREPKRVDRKPETKVSGIIVGRPRRSKANYRLNPTPTRLQK